MDPIESALTSRRPLGPSSRPPGSVGEGGISVQAFVDVLRNRQFRLLFIGQGISALGDWVGTLAFIVAAGELAPGNEAAIAFVLVLRLLPSLFATPLGGVLSDRMDRKSIMVWTDIIRFGIIALVPFIPNLGVLYVLAFAQEVFSLFFLPARDATLPNIVKKEHLEPANALIMGSSFAGIPLAGPVFALLAWVGAQYPAALPGSFIFHERGYAFPFVFDALTYLVSAWFIMRMTLPRHEPVPGGPEEQPFWASAREGARYILSSPLHRGLAWSVSVGMLGGGVLFALGKSYVEETLGGGNVEFGWLMGLFGAGMVGGFFVSQLKPPGGVAWMVRISLIAMGGVLSFMAVFSVLWIGYLAAVGFGLAFSVSVIVAMSAIQAETDDEHRGRVMGSVHMLYRGALVVGALGSAGIATFVPEQGYDLPFGFNPDKNQFALIVSAALIAGGTVGVRGGRSASAPPSSPAP